MTLRHIEYALAVMRAGSINNAARKLMVSQPYLSGMINSLEKELGYALFRRSNLGISCTPQGLLFMEHAEHIMTELDAIRAIDEERKTPLRIATYYSRFITERFHKYRSMSDDPPVDRYREMGNMEVIESVAGREYSLGIIYHARSKTEKFMNLADKNDLEFHTLFEDMKTCLIMTPDHRLADKDDISIEDLRQNPVVFFDDESTVLYMVEHLKIPGSAQFFAAPDRGTFMDALMSGKYLSVINTPYPETERLFRIREVTDQIAGDADMDVSSAYLVHRGHRLTKREREFLDYLKAPF